MNKQQAILKSKLLSLSKSRNLVPGFSVLLWFGLFKLLNHSSWKKSYWDHLYAQNSYCGPAKQLVRITFEISFFWKDSVRKYISSTRSQHGKLLSNEKKPVTMTTMYDVLLSLQSTNKNFFMLGTKWAKKGRGSNFLIKTKTNVFTARQIFEISE